MYYGWADPQLNAKQGVEYYEHVTEAMGPSTGEFFRLFMVPGMFHCGGGAGTSPVRRATPMVKWVEGATAPERIPASKLVPARWCGRGRCPIPRWPAIAAAGASMRRRTLAA